MSDARRVRSPKILTKLHRYLKLWQLLAAKNKINVVACTLAPFGGAEGWKGSLRTNYDKKEAARQKINEEMQKMLGIGGGIKKLVELHKPVKEGATKEDAEKIKKQLETAGAKVTVK